MAPHHQTLRDRQVGRPTTGEAIAKLYTNDFIASIGKILNLNHSPPTNSLNGHDQAAANGPIPQSSPVLNSDRDPIWKVLVFDDLGRDVISSVLRVNDLRGFGVTIHLSALQKLCHEYWC